MEGFEDLDHEAHDGRRGVELTALLPLGAGELAEEVFVDAPEGVEVEADRDLGDFLQQFLEQGAVEDLVVARQHARELRVVFFDVGHRFVDGFADVAAFGPREQVVEAGVWREEQDAFGLVGLGVVDARGAAARGGARVLQLRAALREARLGKAQEDQAEDRPRVFAGLEARIGAELVRRGPKPLLQLVIGFVFLGRRNPAHVLSPIWFAAAKIAQRRSTRGARSALCRQEWGRKGQSDKQSSRAS